MDTYMYIYVVNGQTLNNTLLRSEMCNYKLLLFVTFYCSSSPHVVRYVPVVQSSSPLITYSLISPR